MKAHERLFSERYFDCNQHELCSVLSAPCIPFMMTKCKNASTHGQQKPIKLNTSILHEPSGASDGKAFSTDDLKNAISSSDVVSFRFFLSTNRDQRRHRAVSAYTIPTCNSCSICAALSAIVLERQNLEARHSKF